MLHSLLIIGLALGVPELGSQDAPPAATAVEAAHAGQEVRLLMANGRPRWRQTRDGYTWLLYDGEVLAAEAGPGHKAQYSYDWQRKLVRIRFDNSTSVTAQYGPDGRLVALQSCNGKVVRFPEHPGAGVSPTSMRAPEFHGAIVQLLAPP